MRKYIVLFVLLSLTACSSSSDRKAVYEQKAEHEMLLEAPPDLTMPEGNKALDIPSIGSTSYSDFSGSQQQSDGKILAASSTDARLVRDGSVHWLEIKAGVNNIWPQVMAYFRSEGFEIKRADTRSGLIETDWKENRVDIPTNWFSNLISKLYDSGLRDKYRIRVEKGDGELTRIFISHQGLVEKGTGADIGGEGIIHETYWEVRDSDPELEAEMMQRFLVFRGIGADTARTIVKAGNVQERAVLKEDNSFAYLDIRENFPRSWRRTGIALDRIGLLVEDRNRSAGMYYIKLTEEYWKTHEGKEEGWFAGLFSSSDKNKEASYILKLAGDGDTTQVSMLDRDGNKTTDQISKQLLVQLQRYLR